MNPPISFEPGARIDGGVPLCVPEIRGNEWQYVRECLDTGWVSSVGSYVTRFEGALAQRTNSAYAIATVNGTAALHIALLCAGVAPGDEVLVSTLTFIAPANAISYVGAHPVFIDAEPEYWQMDPARVEAFLTKECTWNGNELRDRANGRRVKAIVPVDILGSPVNIEPIAATARKFGLAVIEDATESLGTKYQGTHVGSHADVTCYSFNGNKLITTGGGGMITTNDAEIAKRARYLTTQAKDDPLEYVHGEVGYNYRLTNVQAAIGLAQMERLDEYIEAKRATAQAYADAFANIEGITSMREGSAARNTFWLYTILVNAATFGMDSRGLMRALASKNIQARPLWQPMHHSPAHRGARSNVGGVADRLCRDAISLPSSVGLTVDQRDAVISAVKDARVR